MCWRTRSFSGWVSDQFHPASSGCEKNCQHQCFVLGGRVGNKGLFWPMGLMDCGSLSTQTPHRHCSVDSPFVPWTIPKFSFHHGKDTAGGVSLSSLIIVWWLKLLLLTHSYLHPQVWHLQPPMANPGFSQKWWPRGMDMPFHMCEGKILLLNDLPWSNAKKNTRTAVLMKKYQVHVFVCEAHVCMWSFMAYCGYSGFDADTEVPQLRFLSQFALLQYICMSDNPMENPSNNNGP